VPELDDQSTFPDATLRPSDRAFLAVCALGLSAGLFALSLYIEHKLDTPALVTPMLLLCQLAIIAWLGRTDTVLLIIMNLGFMAKLLSTCLYAKASAVQDTDLALYFDQGKALAGNLWHVHDLFTAQSLWGTNLIIALVGSLFALIGPSLMAGMFLFASISYWGQYLYYRVYCRAFCVRRSRSAAAAMFLWPSMIFWPATIGKDAIIGIFIALTAYGCTIREKQTSTARWTLILFGIVGTFAIRPQISVLLTVSVAITYLLAGDNTGGRVGGRKLLTLVSIVMLAVPVVYACAQMLQIRNPEDAITMTNNSFEGNEVASSTFDADKGAAERFVCAPLLLFRPFPWEINGVSAVAISAEGVVLIVIAVIRARRLIGLMRRARTNRLVTFAISFLLTFVLLASAVISNFGLLARQRVMVLPFLLMLLVRAGDIRPESAPAPRRT